MKTSIIVDIDGTLADNKRRSPYDMSKIKDDPIIPATQAIVNRAYENVIVILMSGRPETARNDTEIRLHQHGIPYHFFYMRGEDDDRPDTEVKLALYKEHIQWKYNVLFALDDRTRIVDQRRDIGIYTLDVNQTREVF